MAEQTIEYVINNDPIFVEEKRSGGGRVYFWQYQVSNNIELPNYTTKIPAISNPYNFGNRYTKPFKYSQSIGWTWDYSKNQRYGSEPQKLKDLIWGYQKQEIIDDFSTNPPRIPGKSYKNQVYPKGGTLKSLYNQDPIPYTFSSIIVDETSHEPLSGVKIKDLENQKTTSNPDGSFEITGNFSPGKVQKLTFNLKKYGAKSLVITTLNGSIKSDITVIYLNPDNKELRSSILKAQATSDEQKKKLTEEEKKEFIEKTKEKIIEEIKIRLIPYLIKKLLCEPYGVCDPIGLINKAKAAKEKAKDLNERRKERKTKRDKEKKEKEEESINNETLT